MTARCEKYLFTSAIFLTKLYLFFVLHRHANCIAYVEDDEVFYKSVVDIKQGEEIIVHPQLYIKDEGIVDSKFFFSYLNFCLVLS